jgi:hypothetical protein
MTLTKLQFKPGVNRETTSYSNEGGWFDVDKVRFRFGFAEKIGGWLKNNTSNFLGTCRSLHSWVALDGTKFLGVGTHLKYYINEGGAYYDITPERATTTNGITFAATNGSSTITATDSSHGAEAGDFVTIAGAVSLGGNITANILNQEYQIDTVPDSNTYTFTARTASTTIASITTTSGLNPTAVTANASDSGNGGSGVDGVYQTITALDTSVGGTGWGAGTWGRGTWNSNANLAVTGTTLRIWSHDNFGEDLIINAKDAGIFYWDRTNGVSTRAVVLSSLTNSELAPTIAKKVIVSDRDRHIIAFGCDPETAIGTQDPLLIRFSSQESAIDWASKATNTAGDLRIGSGSEIVTTEEMYEVEENRYHIMTAMKQALISARPRGGLIDEGNQIYVFDLGISGAQAQAEVFAYLNFENELIKDGKAPTHEHTMRWLEACADKFADDPQKFAERRGFKLLDSQSLTNTPRITVAAE